ncbi:MAG TPA: DMT family transporter [Acidimicrobiales bacterium]|nr:DMT family transporter [Acidimicrobiales bacterium]
MLLAIGYAVAAAAANAASNVLQRKSNREAAPELSMSPRLILDVAKRPAWLLGFAASALSFVLMFAALSRGSLAAVQPILVLELPLSLLGGVFLFGDRLGGREWAATVLMSVGLAGLIFFLSPGLGDKGNAADDVWLLAGCATVGLAVVCVLAALRSSGGRKAGLLGAASGILFGLTSALMKGVTPSLHHGVTGVLTTWQTYALVVVGAAAMFLMQNALHAGRLVASQPGMTLLDPAIAILWGIFVFQEPVSVGAFLVLGVVSGLVMAGGAVLLTRSPLLEAGEEGTTDHDQTQAAREEAAAAASC